jgi:hypothetical protein
MKYLFAGLLVAGAAMAAPQTASAQFREECTSDRCLNGRYADVERAMRDERDLRRPRYDRRVERERPIVRDQRRHEWRNDRRDDYRWRRHYRSSPDVYIDLSVPSYRYVERRYVEPRYYVPRRAIRLSRAHVEWCYDRWRSYRDWDNTYQPYYGPRKQCFSPYS